VIPRRSNLATLALCGVVGWLVSGGLPQAPAGASLIPPAPANAAAVAALGKRLFFDATLSASGKMSCATCHSPLAAYGPPNARAVQLGGPQLDRAGTRAVPSLRYTLNRVPIWFHEQSTEIGERLIENEAPAGGLTWDGRFDHLRDQAAFPLLNPAEMANSNPASIVAKLRTAPYAGQFRVAFRGDALRDVNIAYASALIAIETFELDDPSFHPYTSKYDAFLDGHATLSTQERHGKQLFDDPLRGGCALCHIDAKGANGAHPLFTDYQFEALAVPRNPEIPANWDPHYYDLGLCGPLRTDKSSVKAYCGLFKTPTLRNVATRRVFFHNGRFHTLRDALRFYVQRDTNPQKWYPLARDGTVMKYDDIPAPYRGNVDVVDPPLASERGKKPVWSERDIDDVIAYLKTLNDGYSPKSYDGGISPLTGRR
jgi:cytochrome c peroxidase